MNLTPGEGGGWTLDLSAAEADNLFRWMQLSAVCLQTWPVVAHEILVAAKNEEMI